MKKVSDINFDSIMMATVVTAPFGVISLISDRHPNTPGRVDPIRQLDLPLLPNFMNHAGNLSPGFVLALSTTVAGSILTSKISPDKNRPLVIAGVAAAISTGVNVIHESGIEIPGAPRNLDNFIPDYRDATYGSFAGLLFTSVFALSAIRLARKSRQ